MTRLQCGIDADLIFLVLQSRQLPVSEAESPCLMIVRGAIRNPIGRLRETKKMLLEFRQSDATAHRNAVVDYMQVALRKVHDLFALSALDPSLPNIPFLWHGPIQNGSAGGHLAQHHRSSLLQIAEALAQSVSGDAATDGVEVPHHVVKGGPFLLEIERLDHFKEISGSIQNGVRGQRSNVQSDSRSLAWLTSEIPSDGFGESARSIIPTVQRSGWRPASTSSLQQRPGKVLRGDRTHRQRPFDPELWVIESQARRIARGVVVSHLIKNLGVILQSLKSMRESFRNVKRIPLFCGQRHRQVLAKRCRVLAQVNDHVMNGPTRAAHQLRFGGRWTLKMHPPDSTSPGIVGHIALDEFRMQSLLREVARAEGTREEPAAVLESLQFNDVHTGEFGLNDTHLPR